MAGQLAFVFFGSSLGPFRTFSDENTYWFNLFF